jgi:hypothetical protein
MGYNALYIIKNFGTLCLTIFAGPAMFLVYQGLAKLKADRFQAGKIWWEKGMKFNYWITLISETYMFLAVCSGLNLFFYCRWDSIGDSVNSVMAIVCSSLILLMPFFVLIWFSYPKNYIKVLKQD